VCVWGGGGGVKWAGREADQSPPTVAEARYACFRSFPKINLHSMVLRQGNFFNRRMRWAGHVARMGL
jgi:hypothetical protein